MTTVLVYACQRCLKEPATQHDGYADLLLCAGCAPDPDTTYGCPFVLDYIPDRALEADPDRPTIEVEVP